MLNYVGQLLHNDATLREGLVVASDPGSISLPLGSSTDQPDLNTAQSVPGTRVGKSDATQPILNQIEMDSAASRVVDPAAIFEVSVGKGDFSEATFSASEASSPHTVVLGLPLHLSGISPAFSYGQGQGVAILSGRDPIVITFNRAVLHLSEQAVAPPPQGLSMLGTTVPGQWRWATTSSLQFDPEVAWPPELRFRLRIDDTLTTFEGVQLSGLEHWGTHVKVQENSHLQHQHQGGNDHVAQSGHPTHQASEFEFVTDNVGWKLRSAHSETSMALTGQHWSAEMPFMNEDPKRAPEIPPDASFELHFTAPISLSSLQQWLRVRQAPPHVDHHHHHDQHRSGQRHQPHNRTAPESVVTAHELHFIGQAANVGPCLTTPVSVMQYVPQRMMTGDEATCARVTLVPEVALLFLPDTEYDLMLPVGAVLHPYSGALTSERSIRVSGLYPFHLPFVQEAPLTPESHDGLNGLRPMYRRLRMMLRHGLMWSYAPSLTESVPSSSTSTSSPSSSDAAPFLSFLEQHSTAATLSTTKAPAADAATTDPHFHEGVLPMFGAEETADTAVAATSALPHGAMLEHGLLVPDAAALRRDTLSAANWNELRQSAQVRAVLTALRDSITIDPPLPPVAASHAYAQSEPSFTLEWVSPHAIDIVGDFQPDMVYTISVHGSTHVRDGYGQKLQPGSTSFRTADIAPFLELVHDQVSQYLTAPHQNPGHGTAVAAAATAGSTVPPPEHPPLIIMTRGRPTIGSWLPANSPMRIKYAQLMDRSQSVVATPVTREHVVEALASLFSQYRNFMPHGASVYNVSVDEIADPHYPHQHVGVKVEDGVEMHLDAKYRLRQMILDTEPLLKPSGAYLVERWNSLLWLNSVPTPSKANALVTVSDLAASVVLFGTWVTVWISPASTNPEAASSLEGVDVSFYGICDDLYHPSLDKVHQLMSGSTSSQGLWKVPLASLRFACDSGGWQRLVLVAFHDNRPLILPIYLAAELHPEPTHSSHSSAEVSSSSPAVLHGKDAANVVNPYYHPLNLPPPVCSQAEADLVDIAALFSDVQMYRAGDSVAIKGYVRVHAPSESYARSRMPPYTFRYRLRVVMRTDGSQSDARSPLQASVEYFRPIIIDPRFGSFSTAIWIPADTQINSMVDITLQRVVRVEQPTSPAHHQPKPKGGAGGANYMFGQIWSGLIHAAEIGVMASERVNVIASLQVRVLDMRPPTAVLQLQYLPASGPVESVTFQKHHQDQHSAPASPSSTKSQDQNELKHGVFRFHTDAAFVVHTHMGGDEDTDQRAARNAQLTVRWSLHPVIRPDVATMTSSVFTSPYVTSTEDGVHAFASEDIDEDDEDVTDEDDDSYGTATFLPVVPPPLTCMRHADSFIRFDDPAFGTHTFASPPHHKHDPADAAITGQATYHQPQGDSQSKFSTLAGKQAKQRRRVRQRRAAHGKKLNVRVDRHRRRPSQKGTRHVGAELLSGQFTVQTDAHGVAMFHVLQNVDRPEWLERAEGELRVRVEWLTPTHERLSSERHLVVPAHDHPLRISVMQSSSHPLPGSEFYVNARVSDSHCHPIASSLPIEMRLYPLHDDDEAKLCQQPPTSPDQWLAFLKANPHLRTESTVCYLDSLPASKVHDHTHAHHRRNHHQLGGQHSIGSGIAVGMASFDKSMICKLTLQRPIRYVLVGSVDMEELAKEKNKKKLKLVEEHHVLPYIGFLGMSARQYAELGVQPSQVQNNDQIQAVQEEYVIEHGETTHIKLFVPHTGVSALLQWGEGLTPKSPSSASASASPLLSASNVLQMQVFSKLKQGVTKLPLTITAYECLEVCQALLLIHVPPQPHRFEQLPSGVRISPLVDASVPRAFYRVFRFRVRPRPPLQISISILNAQRAESSSKADKTSLLQPGSAAHVLIRVNDPEASYAKSMPHSGRYEVCVWAVETAWLDVVKQHHFADTVGHQLHELWHKLNISNVMHPVHSPSHSLRLPRVQVQDSRDHMQSNTVHAHIHQTNWKRLRRDPWVRPNFGTSIFSPLTERDEDFELGMHSTITHGGEYSLSDTTKGEDASLMPWASSNVNPTYRDFLTRMRRAMTEQASDESIESLYSDIDPLMRKSAEAAASSWSSAQAQADALRLLSHVHRPRIFFQAALPTDSSDEASFEFKLPDDIDVGAYTVYATAVAAATMDKSSNSDDRSPDPYNHRFAPTATPSLFGQAMPTRMLVSRPLRLTPHTPSFVRVNDKFEVSVHVRLAPSLFHLTSSSSTNSHTSLPLHVRVSQHDWMSLHLENPTDSITVQAPFAAAITSSGTLDYNLLEQGVRVAFVFRALRLAEDAHIELTVSIGGESAHSEMPTASEKVKISFPIEGDQLPIMSVASFALHGGSKPNQPVAAHQSPSATLRGSAALDALRQMTQTTPSMQSTSPTAGAHRELPVDQQPAFEWPESLRLPAAEHGAGAVEISAGLGNSAGMHSYARLLIAHVPALWRRAPAFSFHHMHAGFARRLFHGRLLRGVFHQPIQDTHQQQHDAPKLVSGDDMCFACSLNQYQHTFDAEKMLSLLPLFYLRQAVSTQFQSHLPPLNFLVSSLGQMTSFQYGLSPSFKTRNFFACDLQLNLFGIIMAQELLFHPHLAPPERSVLLDHQRFRVVGSTNFHASAFESELHSDSAFASGKYAPPTQPPSTADDDGSENNDSDDEETYDVIDSQAQDATTTTTDPLHRQPHQFNVDHHPHGQDSTPPSHVAHSSASSVAQKQARPIWAPIRFGRPFHRRWQPQPTSQPGVFHHRVRGSAPGLNHTKSHFRPHTPNPFADTGNGDDGQPLLNTVAQNDTSTDAPVHMQWSDEEKHALEQLHVLVQRWRRATLTNLYERVRDHVKKRKENPELGSFATHHQTLMAEVHFAFNGQFDG